MFTLFILNGLPYDGSDVTWNALRLATSLQQSGAKIRVFLMNDAVDLAREALIKPEDYEFDLTTMLKTLWQQGVPLKVCGSCQARCGLLKNQPYFHPDIKGTMNDLTQWVQESSKVLTF